MTEIQKKLAYTTNEVAELLGVTRRTIASYIRDGKIKAYHLNPKKLIIKSEDLQAFLDSLELREPGKVNIITKKEKQEN